MTPSSIVGESAGRVNSVADKNHQYPPSTTDTTTIIIVDPPNTINTIQKYHYNHQYTNTSTLSTITHNNSRHTREHTFGVHPDMIAPKRKGPGGRMMQRRGEDRIGDPEKPEAQHHTTNTTMPALCCSCTSAGALRMGKSWFRISKSSRISTASNFCNFSGHFTASLASR